VEDFYVIPHYDANADIGLRNLARGANSSRRFSNARRKYEPDRNADRSSSHRNSADNDDRSANTNHHESCRKQHNADSNASAQRKHNHADAGKHNARNASLEWQQRFTL
jgi:hypothetical protein